MDDIYRVYFKDLLKTTQKKIRKWFEDHDIDIYHDEEGVKRSIEEVYDSKIPFYGFLWVDDSEEEDTIFMDMMVV